MIEAVNSVLSNAPVLRAPAEQVSAARSNAADSVSRIPQAPYISPYISLDLNYDKAVLQIRDSETGDVVRQFPSESTLEAARRAALASELGSSVPVSSDTPDIAIPDAAPVGEGSNGGVGFVAQAQIASAALSAGARSGVESLSAGVSVLA